MRQVGLKGAQVTCAQDVIEAATFLQVWPLGHLRLTVSQVEDKRHCGIARAAAKRKKICIEGIVEIVWEKVSFALLRLLFHIIGLIS